MIQSTALSSLTFENDIDKAPKGNIGRTGIKKEGHLSGLRAWKYFIYKIVFKF